KGGKSRQRGKKEMVNQRKHAERRDLLFKEVSQEYAYIEKSLGTGRFRARPLKTDGSGRQPVLLGIVRGNMRHKVFVHQNDIVLLTLRDFEDSKADIIHLYTESEVRKLIEYGELPKTALASPFEDGAYDGNLGDENFIEFD
ncbi:nucleic acid-binding protein, partial [Hypoxylon sp. EC38]